MLASVATDHLVKSEMTPSDAVVAVVEVLTLGNGQIIKLMADALIKAHKTVFKTVLENSEVLAAGANSDMLHTLANARLVEVDKPLPAFTWAMPSASLVGSQTS